MASDMNSCESILLEYTGNLKTIWFSTFSKPSQSTIKERKDDNRTDDRCRNTTRNAYGLYERMQLFVSMNTSCKYRYKLDASEGVIRSVALGGWFLDRIVVPKMRIPWNLISLSHSMRWGWKR